MHAADDMQNCVLDLWVIALLVGSANLTLTAILF